MFNIKNYILATQFICVLRAILNINSNYSVVRNELAGLSKGKTLCCARNIFTYRVSIKSFPDYKHLLQEKYCMWNTNFFFKMKPKKFFITTHQYTSTCAPFVARRTSNR